MPNLQKIIKLKKEQYDLLSQGQTVGSLTGLNSNFIYLVEDDETEKNHIIHINLDMDGEDEASFELTQEQATACRNINKDVVIDINYFSNIYSLKRYFLDGEPTFEFESETSGRMFVVKGYLDDSNILSIEFSSKKILSEDVYLESSEKESFRNKINAGTVTSVQVQASGGLTSSTSSAQSSSLSTVISVDSSHKLPTTTEWNSKANVSALPTVNNGTLTIQKNGTQVATFSANQSGNATANITVPTKVSDLTNDSGFISSETNQKVKADNKTFGNNDVVEIKAGTNVQVAGDTTNKTITISATDTTYESKAAASGGTAVSLVTTGEKATWNAKQNALTSQTAYSAKGTTTKVPQITTNSLGQVTGITEVNIAFPADNNDNQKITAKSGSSNVSFGANDTIEIVAGDNVTVTPSTTNKTITIAASQPTIPTVNNGTLSIQGAGETASTFTANQSGNTTLNIKGSGGTTVTKSAANEITISTGTIPTVNNSTITVKQTGQSDQTFTLNGSAKTITLADTNTWRPLGTGASDACAGNDSRLSNSRPASDVPSWAKQSDLSAGVNTLSEGTSAAQRDDYIVAQYAGGGTSTTTYHRRKISNLFKAMNSSDVTTALGYTPPTTNTTYSNATTSTAGLMSTTDKSRLDSIWAVWSADGTDDTLVNKVQEVLNAFDSFSEGSTIVGLLANKVDTTDSRLTDSRTPKSHTHGNVTNDGKITATAVTAASGIVVVDSSNLLQKVTNMATFRSIIGAGTSSFSGSYNDLSNKPTIPTKSSWNYDDAYVKYSASQSLTSDQKAQARTNIGAGTSSFSGSYNDLSNKPTIPSVSNATITIKQTGLNDQTFTLNGSATTITLADNNTWRPVGTGASDAAAGNHTHGNISNTGTITSTAVTSATGVLVYDSDNKIQRATAANARAIIGAGTSSFSGNYNDLTNKPTIPTVNNATLTIQKNGTTVKTFTANASSDVTANITVPTKVSDLTNDSGFTSNAGTVTSVDSVSPSSGNVGLSAVRYVSQSLTDTQKAQARTNIGAGTSSFTGYTSSNKLSTSYIQNDAGWTSNAGTVTKVNSTSPDSSGNVTITIPTKSSWNYDDSYVKYTASQSLSDTQKAQARSNIGAGTSNLTIGTTATTAAAGNHTHSGYYQKPSDGIPGSDLKKSDLIDLIYPVGAIYISVVNTSPATLFGGTWEQIEDVFLLSAGESYDAGDTGGASSVTITTSQMPYHRHTYAKANSSTGSTTLTVDQIPSHNHYINLLSGWAANQSNVTSTLQSMNFSNTKRRPVVGVSVAGSFWEENELTNASNIWTSQAAAGGTTSYFGYHVLGFNCDHQHWVSGDSGDKGGGGSHNHTMSTTSTYTGYAGGSSQQAVSIMPPYLVVYMWKRTA